MSQALIHFQAGELELALQQAIEGVRSHPSDRAKRRTLSEISLFLGDFERADKHWDFLNNPHAKPDLGVAVSRQLLRAEATRREVFLEGRVPEFLQPPPNHLQLALQILIDLRKNEPEAAAEKVRQMHAETPAKSWLCNEQPIPTWRDLDDLTAGFLEVLTSNGTYYWVPWEVIQSLEFREPKSIQDLYWRSTHIQVNDGPEGEVYTPTLYIQSHTSLDNNIRLGRASDYSGVAPVRGLGLREFLCGDDATKTILELHQLELAE